MPTPPHLTALLAALGDGGTVATCEAVCAAAGGIPGHVPAPHVDGVMAALGDTASRDTADRVLTVYTDAAPAPAVGVAVVHHGRRVNLGCLCVADDWEEDIDWDDEPTEPAPVDAPKPEPSAATIRAWAKTTGVKVPARGGIPQDVRAAYDAAH